MITNRDEVIGFLKTVKWGLDETHVDENGRITFPRTLSFEKINWKEIPVQFGHCGTFYVDHNILNSLKGAPISCVGDFDCSHNKIRTLEFLPKSMRRLNATACPYLKPSGCIPALFSKMESITLNGGLKRTAKAEAERIIMDGRIDGVMPRELIPSKINELRDLDAAR
jgi:hypothetical protein